MPGVCLSLLLPPVSPPGAPFVSAAGGVVLLELELLFVVAVVVVVVVVVVASGVLVVGAGVMVSMALWSFAEDVAAALLAELLLALVLADLLPPQAASEAAVVRTRARRTV